ncbi:PDZ domain-containing protein [Luteipulveratus sp. YIM 133132]|uniref:endopeptidase La n=1 Tax=Luteipulveratus flavus TaxID=3031728 RepID=A0ABT6C9N0_9MICO|nr:MULTISPECIES: S16 family serine protease [unclassified Luteipulveratus]MDE9365860.1 PDZ domain-containing protein [Luteipulveratus sp. YIM 133132]MDF8265052.1 PDZ domain-containing protein [Luteipulveratus sp. YIM 133296]
MSTQQVAPPGQRRRTTGGGLSRRTTWLLVVVVLAVIIGAVGQMVKMPYAIFSPGPAQDTLGKTGKQDIIAISGAPTYPTSGRLDFTTVSLYGGPNYPVSLWQWLRAKTDDDSQIVPEERVFPKGVTGKQVEQENTAEMVGSQQAAEVVGVRAAGKKVGETVSVGAVSKGRPADGRLKAGDRIESIDGRPATTLAAVHQRMDSVQAGGTVQVVVTRAGTRQTVAVPTVKDPQSGRAVIGITLAPKFDFPVEIKVNAGDVGGPSAGLMFSLAIYDKLTPGPLTAGKEFAGTGTIDTDGTVGPIGGIRQKLVGARDDGADFFLAPKDNCNEVKGHVPDGMTVIKVTTFADARSSVEKVAKGQTSGLPSCG